jgi:hypothetical protein
MKQRNLWILFVVLIVVVLGIFYLLPPSVTGDFSLAEQDVIEIPLAGPLADRSAEISGLAWADDNLVLLPQYPGIFDENEAGLLFYIPKDEILAFLDGKSQAPLEPRPIQLIAPELADQIRNFQGFESIGFSGARVFLTIESGSGTEMMGYLIAGMVSPDFSIILLDTARLAQLPPQAKYENLTDESILVLNDRVITFYEANGELMVTDPVAHVFDYNLRPTGTIPLDHIEYRLTDTALASSDEFWGINYLFQGDTFMIPFSDPIADVFGKGPTQKEYPQVERLVKFHYTPDGISLVDSAPVSLSLVEDARNWEGLALLDDRGFLLATDKFPTTILGFVPMP